jgi:hypothetical protein
MQGLDPVLDPVALQKLRKTTGWKPPAEVDALPTFPGWKGIGARIREVLAPEKAAEATRLGVAASLSQADSRLFPPLASAWQTIRLNQKVENLVDELRRRRGGGTAPVGAATGPQPDASDEADGMDEDEPPSFL